jgi:hypothetical protein
MRVLLSLRALSAVAVDAGITVTEAGRDKQSQSSSAGPSSTVALFQRELLLLLEAVERNQLALPTAGRRARWPEDEPPLVFCARHRPLRGLALALLSSGLAAASTSLDATSKDGLTALHLAALQNDVELIAALCAAGVDAALQSQDNRAAQLPGGRTALHCVRSAAAAAVLIGACPAALLVPDWQGCYPAQVAGLHGANTLAALLAARTLEHESAAGRGGGVEGSPRLDAEDRAEIERLQRGVTGDTVADEPDKATYDALLRVDLKDRARRPPSISAPPPVHLPPLGRARPIEGSALTSLHRSTAPWTRHAYPLCTALSAHRRALHILEHTMHRQDAAQPRRAAGAARGAHAARPALPRRVRAALAAGQS